LHRSTAAKYSRHGSADPTHKKAVSTARRLCRLPEAKYSPSPQTPGSAALPGSASSAAAAASSISGIKRT